MFLQIAISYLSTKNELFKKFISGYPTILIEKGKLNIKNLSRLRITTTDLLEQLRIQGCPSISNVEYAIMESNGQLSVIQKAENIPLTPKDMDLAVTQGVLPAIIISDGNVYDSNLIFSGISLMQFEDKLRKAGITDMKEVFLAFCDGEKRIHVYLTDKSSGTFAKEVII